MQNSSTISKERYAWIDVAKGYGILCVIWAHLPNEGLNPWIYSFHMPLFFFLSGYVFHIRYDFREFVKRKVKTLIVPYFGLGIPMVLFEWIRYVIKGEALGEAIFRLLKEFLVQNRYLTLWYIACLFWLNLIFYGLAKYIKREWLLLGISFAMPGIGLVYYGAGGDSLPWNIDTCLMAIPFFATGYWYKLHKESVEGRLRNGRKRGIVFGLCLIGNVGCCVATWILSGEGLEMFYNQYGSPVFTYSSAFMGIVCIIIFAKQWTMPRLQQLGENSMLYYAWHQTIMIPIVQLLLAWIGWNIYNIKNWLELVGYKLVCVVLILIFTALCDYMIKKLGWTFLLGKA